MNKQKELWEKLAKENSKYYINSDKGRNITDDDFRKSGLITYQKYIKSDKLVGGKDTILDYGCGNGRLTEFMAQDFKKVIGVDISRTMINEANTRLKNFDNVFLIETDGITIPIADTSVDVVFAYLVFQHIKTREMVEKTFEEIYRILNPDGIFKVLLRNDKQKDMGRWWSGVEYNEESIKIVYEKFGFKLIKITPEDQHAFWLSLQK